MTNPINTTEENELSPLVINTINSLEFIKENLIKELTLIESEKFYRFFTYLKERQKTVLLNNHCKDSIKTGSRDALNNLIIECEKCIDSKERIPFSEENITNTISKDTISGFNTINFNILQDTYNPLYETELMNLIKILKNNIELIDKFIDDQSSRSNNVNLNKSLDDKILLSIFEKSTDVDNLIFQIDYLKRVILDLKTNNKIPSNVYQLESFITHSEKIKVRSLRDNTQKIIFKASETKASVVINKGIEKLFSILYPLYSKDINLRSQVLTGKSKEEIYSMFDKILSLINPKYIISSHSEAMTDGYADKRRKAVYDTRDLSSNKIEGGYIDLPIFIHKPYLDIRTLEDNTKELVFMSTIYDEFSVNYPLFLEKEYDTKDSVFYSVKGFLEEIYRTDNCSATTFEIPISTYIYQDAFITEYRSVDDIKLPYIIYTDNEIRTIINDKILKSSMNNTCHNTILASAVSEIMETNHRAEILELFKKYKPSFYNANLNQVYDVSSVDDKLTIYSVKHKKAIENRNTLYFNNSSLEYYPLSLNASKYMNDSVTAIKIKILRLLQIYLDKFENEYGYFLPINLPTLSLVFEIYKEEFLEQLLPSYTSTINYCIESIKATITGFNPIQHSVLEDINRNRYNQQNYKQEEKFVFDSLVIEDLLTFFNLKVKVYEREKEAGLNPTPLNLTNLNLKLNYNMICLEDLWGLQYFKDSRVILKAKDHPALLNLIYIIYRFTIPVNISLERGDNKKMKVNEKSLLYTEITNQIDSNIWLNNTILSTEDEVKQYIRYIGNVLSCNNYDPLDIKRGSTKKIDLDLFAYIYIKALEKYYEDKPKEELRTFIFNNILTPKVNPNVTNIVENLEEDEWHNILSKLKISNNISEDTLNIIKEKLILISKFRKRDITNLLHWLENAEKDDINTGLLYIGFNKSDFTSDTINDFNDIIEDNATKLKDMAHPINIFETEALQAIQSSFIRDILFTKKILSSTLFHHKVNKESFETVNEKIESILKTTLKCFLPISQADIFNITREEVLSDGDFKILNNLLEKIKDKLSLICRDTYEQNIITETLSQMLVNVQSTLNQKRIKLKANEKYVEGQSDISNYKTLKTISDSLIKINRTKSIYDILHKVITTPESIARVKVLHDTNVQVNKQVETKIVKLPNNQRNIELYNLYLNTRSKKILDQIDINNLPPKILCTHNFFRDKSFADYHQNNLIEKFKDEIFGDELIILEEIMQALKEGVKTGTIGKNLSPDLFGTEPLEFLFLLTYIMLNEDTSDFLKQYPIEDLRTAKYIIERLDNTESLKSLSEIVKEYISLMTNINDQFNCSGLIEILTKLEASKKTSPTEINKFVKSLPLPLQNELFNYFMSLDEDNGVDKIIINSDFNILNFS